MKNSGEVILTGWLGGETYISATLNPVENFGSEKNQDVVKCQDVNYQKLHQDVLKTSPKHIFIFHIQPFCQNSLSSKEKRPGNDMKTSLKPP